MSIYCKGGSFDQTNRKGEEKVRGIPTRSSVEDTRGCTEADTTTTGSLGSKKENKDGKSEAARCRGLEKKTWCEPRGRMTSLPCERCAESREAFGGEKHSGF